MLTNGGEARVLGENSPLALALPKALGRAIVSESETRSDCIKSSLVVIISVTCTKVGCDLASESSVQNQSSQLGAGAARLGCEALPGAMQPGTWWSEASASGR